MDEYGDESIQHLICDCPALRRVKFIGMYSFRNLEKKSFVSIFPEKKYFVRAPLVTRIKLIYIYPRKA